MNALLEGLLREFLAVIAPFRVGMSSPAETQAMFAHYGWNVEVDAHQFELLQAAFALEPVIEQLAARTDLLVNGNDQQRVQALVDVLQSVKGTAGRFMSLQDATVPVAPFDQPVFWTELADAIIGDLVVLYLERRAPLLFSVLHAFGVIRFETVTPSGLGRIPYVRSTLDYVQLGLVFVNPGKVFREFYGWGSGNFDHNKLLRTLERIALALGGVAEITPPKRRLADGHLDLMHASHLGIQQLSWTLINGEDTIERLRWRMGVQVLPVPRQADNGVPDGIVVAPILEGGTGIDIPLGATVSLRFTGAFSATDSFRAALFPDIAAVDIDPGQTEVAATLALIGTPILPYILFGARRETRLELDGFLFECGLTGSLSQPELFLGVRTGEATGKLRLVVAFDGEQDSFVQRFIGQGFSAEFGLGVLWSSRSGFAILGNAGLDFELPIDVDLQFLRLQRLYISSAGDSSGTRISLGVSAVLDIGPIKASVLNIGASLSIGPASNGDGTFGPVNLVTRFKPPTGISFAIDAGPVKGGGAIGCDPDRQQYDGILQLSIQNTITVNAIGLLNARLPDGKPGFSLLIIITAEFPPIQLGMGFTLSGLGGLAGINRTAAVDVLRAGLRNGALDSILFPPDPLHNVPALLHTVSSVFPVAEKRYVFGPMVRVGWGSPTILTLDVAVLIELPDPVRIILLGRLKATLPDPKKPVVIIRMDAVGVLDFGRQELSLDATIYDSRLLTFTISGDMAMRLLWGTHATFLLSIGGFHPHFPAPSGMVVLGRIAIVLIDMNKDGITARVRLDTYFALTSNTVQFGARVEAYFAASGVEIQGLLGFDALIHVPFAIEAEMVAAVTLSFNGAMLMGADVALMLTGPTPWVLVGEAHFVFLGIKASAPIKIIKSDTAPAETELPPPMDLAKLLLEALADARNWHSALPEGTESIAALKPAPSGEGSYLLVHPLSSLSLRQRVAPLGVELNRFGNALLQDGTSTFDLVMGAPSESVTRLLDSFAMAQYHAMSDDEKLSRPSFEPAVAGLTFVLPTFAVPANDVFLVPDAQYEERLVGAAAAATPAPAIVDMSTYLLKRSAPAQANMRSQGKSRYVAASDGWRKFS